MTKKIEIELPVIPHEVAEAIEEISRGYLSTNHSAVISYAINAGSTERVASAMRMVPFDTLISALVNGYEVELSAEEKRAEAVERISDAYKRRVSPSNLIKTKETFAYDQGFAAGIKYTLNELEETVEGVNA